MSGDTVETRFAVRLTPRAAVDGVDGVVGGMLRVRVRAPAVEGAANAALVRLLATELGVPKSTVRIIAGGSTREKVLVVDGLGPDVVRSRWPGIRSGTTGAHRVSSAGRRDDGTDRRRSGPGD